MTLYNNLYTHMRMVKALTLATLLGILSSVSMASEEPLRECPKHTPEQKVLIYKAYAKGAPYDLGLTLAAIVVRESFVWKYIVRINPEDGELGSYGISHVTLTYAMEQEDYKSQWRAKDELVMKMMTDDDYVLDLSILKLLDWQHRGWRGMVQKYNGTGQAAIKYRQAVANNVKMLKQCYHLL